MEKENFQYKHNKKSGIFTIPKHRGKVKKEVLNAILKQADLKVM